MSEHPDEKIAYSSPVFQHRLGIQKANFGYGLMSMDDVELTDATTDPAQDERDAGAYLTLVTAGGDAVLERDGGGEQKRQLAIKHIYREAKHPLGALWDWARRGESRRARYRRWRSLQFWAMGKRESSEGSEDWKKWNGIRREYRRMKRRVYRAIHDNDDGGGGGTMVTLDGKPCPAWIASRILARRQQGWSGILVSGYRTPAYSQQLCYNICGRPSCPGLCAGTSSNHCCPPSFTGVPYEGAVDVSYYWEFGEYDHLYNNLPNDRVHFSNSGF